MVYKANDAGYPGALDSMPTASGCTTSCVLYRWVPSKNRFRYAQGSWVSRDISACASPALGPLDSVGVFLAVDYDVKTGVFGSSFRLADRAVMKFEPLSNATCKAGEHL
jgi:hypothetical protein